MPVLYISIVYDIFKNNRYLSKEAFHMDTLDNLTQYPIYFAPGCRLLRSEPEMIRKIHDYLRGLFGNITLYTRCCGFDDAGEHEEEAVFITLCPSCFAVYGRTYANLHLRDFRDVYAEYGNIYPFAGEAEIRKFLAFTAAGTAPEKEPAVRSVNCPETD